jgi:hypothetical protein
MTIEEAVNTWMPVVAMGVEGMPEIKEAVRMAIASLEAWEKVKQEIEDMLETLSDGGDDWFTAEKLNDVLEIINKHLQEVESE